MRRGASIFARVDSQGSRISHGEPRGSVELEQVQLQQQQQAQQYVLHYSGRDWESGLTRRVSPQELEFQETLIAEREAEIRDIESGIHELNDIFRDLGTIVEQQGGLIGGLVAGLHRTQLTSRQHRVQHHFRRSEHLVCCGRAYHRARVPTQSRATDGLSARHPGHRPRCDSLGCTCAAYIWDCG